MRSNTYKIVSLAAFLTLLAITIYMYRPNHVEYTRITVMGDSQAKIAPDTAVVSFAVVTQRSSAIEAQQENARKSEAVKAAIEALAANSKIEFKTSDYSLSPERDYSSGGGPKIAGYEVRNTVTASISDLMQIGSLIDAATKAGANSVEDIAFVVREDSPAQGEALAMATKQAMAKAESIAASLHGRIVRVIETHESGAPQLPSSSAYSNAAANVAYTTPVQAGRMDVRSQVTLVVEVAI
jgi:uncharacterized protein YggE